MKFFQVTYQLPYKNKIVIIFLLTGVDNTPHFITCKLQICFRKISISPA